MTLDIAELRPLKVGLVGGCVLEFASQSVTSIGRRYGYRVECAYKWPTPGSFGAVELDEATDFVVLQPTIQPLLSRLWDDAPFITAHERGRRLKAMVRFLEGAISDFAASLRGCFGLVHNVAPPSVSPYGRWEYRTEFNYRQIVAELNAVIDSTVARHDHLMVVDEERLANRHGAANLFDDLLFPFGHHGGSVDTEVDAPHQVRAVSDLLAEEYFACYSLFVGTGRFKAVVVDLDGVLWPGVAVDDGAEWVERDTTTRWIHQGLNQALRLLHRRGILLVSLSKGDPEATLASWRAMVGEVVISPDEFVMHSIAWKPKPDRMRQICDRLGFRREQILFLDDHPAEQHEMGVRMPGVEVYGGRVSGFRARLLSDWRCEGWVQSDDAGRRTATTRAMLDRDELSRGVSRDEFLRQLKVRVDIHPPTMAERDRAVELLTRTSQFTTLGGPVSRAEANALLDDPELRVLVAEVADQFAEYGLTGVVILREDGPGPRVAAMVLSCRVIGLEVAESVLADALEASGGVRDEVGIAVVAGQRNAPALEFLRSVGFQEREVGLYVLADPEAFAASRGRSHVEGSAHG